MRTFHLWLRICVLLLCVLLGIRALAPLVTWAHDGRAQSTTPYHRTSSQASDYNSPPEPVANADDPMVTAGVRGIPVEERVNGTNGFNWTALYDGLGRRLRTVQTVISNNVPGGSLGIDSFYDPQVEFLEIAVVVNGELTWKIYGPDLNGQYGGMQGIGGLEATVRMPDGLFKPMLNDYFGNTVGWINTAGAYVWWNPTKLSSYGPLVGDKPTELGETMSLAEVSLWKGKRIDPTGFYYLGARYYDPQSGRFISPDPLGHEGSMDLYSYAHGDPLNQLDPDGRFGRGFVDGIGRYGSDLYASMGNGLNSFLGAVTEGHWPGYAARNFSHTYQPDFSYEKSYRDGSDAYRLGQDMGYAATPIIAMAMAGGAFSVMGEVAAGAAISGRSVAAASMVRGSMMAEGTAMGAQRVAQAEMLAARTITANSGRAGTTLNFNLAAKTPVDKSWKALIEGTAQKTGTPGHQFRTYREAINMAKSGEYSRIRLNRAYSTTDEVQSLSRRRPDILGIRRDGRVDAVEVPSWTDDPRALFNRNWDVFEDLSDLRRGDVIIAPIR